MPSPIEKPGTNRAFSLGLGRQAKHQNEGISMCYGTNCGREGAFGTCYHPEDCIMRAIERDAKRTLPRGWHATRPEPGAFPLPQLP